MEKMMLSKYKKCWIMVTDSRQARIFRYERPKNTLIQLSVKTSAQHWRLAKKLSQPASGRAFDRSGKGRHIIERHSGAEEKIERKFLKRLLSDLEKSARQGKFEHLVLIADPRSLGHLREYSGGGLKKYIIEEFPLDLAHVPTDDLSEHVGKLLHP